MQCRVCGSHNFKERFKQTILNKYIVSYFLCNDCGCLQTENPFWLEEAYENSINKSDTGYISRNTLLSKRTFLLFLWFFKRKEKFLDYAGGYGLLVRLMRDYGFDFFWEDKYTENIFARGFEYTNQKIGAITCFECFEHLESPILEIEKMLLISKNIYFSTFLVDDKKIPDVSWWYYGFNHGQHICFYSKKTLEYIAKKHNLYLYTDGASNHLFVDKKISKILFYFIVKIARFFPCFIFSKLFMKSKTKNDSRIFLQN